MKRLLPKGMASQLVVVLVLALVVAQAVSIVLFVGGQEAALRAVRAREIAIRMESLVNLLTTVPAAVRGDVLDAVNSEYARFSISQRPSVKPNVSLKSSRLLTNLRRRLEAAGVETVRISNRGRAQEPPRRPPPPPAFTAGPDKPPPPRRPQPPPLNATQVMVSAQLPGGEWVNADFYAEAPKPLWNMPRVLGTALAAVAMVVVVVLMVRRLSRPLSELADTADRLGRGQDAMPLSETGPDEVRRTIHAFNTMTVRLRRFIDGQTRMLAAISHDLKTPITSLRIRAEFVEDGENREKMMATLEDMQRITEATLAFARDDTAREPSRTVDLAALVESVCADVSDIGADVTLTETTSLPFVCKPNGLRRAIRNLVENAVKYGERARVAIEPTTDAVRILIDDDGPGISATDRERVFEPFVRLEESRSRETGGIGLGLSIARSIVQSHGGELVLTNRREGGLLAEITLPRAPGKV